MNKIPKTYEAAKYEDAIYKLWEKSGFFSPDKIESSEKYCNVLPPPNANGELHVGHASGYAVMDILGRYHRMKGEKTLLLPGKDHAGILTQIVYEEKIKEERNTTRYDLGREKFYKECYDFSIGRADYMRAQEKKIGISADWSRERFTLDLDVLKIALETFVKMYDDGMVYRGTRIINWCPRCATALSNLEVIHKETDGKLYYIKYPLKDATDFITVATTRPETILGDTAVAVNPKDKKYEKLVGRTAVLPLMDREIPIIADRRIEMEFGTGAVKITPAHDTLDYKIGEDHKLDPIQVTNEKAEITKDGGKYAGQAVLSARENIIKDLESLRMLEKTEDTKINVSICERCKCVIEPLLSKQWFVNVDAKKYSLKKESLKAIKSGKIKIYPESFKKILIQWFSNLEDWCISRQIWWGPRMPVWYKNDDVYVGIEAPKDETNFVFLHGFLPTTKVINPFPWLIKNLPFNDKNFAGKLPKYDNPDFEAQFNYARESLHIDENTVLIGHSLGTVLAMNYLEMTGTKIKKLVLIAPLLQNKNFKDGKARPEVESYGNLNYDYKKIKSLADEIVVFRDINDHIISYDEPIKIAKSLGAKLIEIEAPKSHFNCHECSELLEELNKSIWVQEEDTFDTWFTSGQWAYSTLGYSSGKDYKSFYPTDMMIMGRDILFFWSARMIMLSLYRTGKTPFKNLLFTGLIRDKKGQKMSKSKGNGIDPLKMIESYGADALRLALIMDTAPGADSRLSEEKIESYRNYITKIWNIYRYCIASDSEFELTEKISETDIKTISDKWIISRLQNTILEVDKFLEAKNISLAQEKIRKFIWDDLADWYLEISKIEKNKYLLGYLLGYLLKISHPFMPFITEKIWQDMRDGKELLMVEKWPVVEQKLIDKKIEKEFNDLQIVITKIRNLRASYKIIPSVIIKAYGSDIKNSEIIEKLARIKIISGKPTSKTIRVAKLDLDVRELIDVEKEKERRNKEIKNLESLIRKNEALLENEKFLKSAPTEIIKQNKNRMSEYKEKLKNQEELLKNLG